MKTMIKRIRQGAIFVAGLIVVILGIILIPLPGPGLVVVLLGLVILSTEFDWAKHYVERLKTYMKQATDKARSALAKARETPKAPHDKDI